MPDPVIQTPLYLRTGKNGAGPQAFNALRRARLEKALKNAPAPATPATPAKQKARSGEAATNSRETGIPKNLPGTTKQTSPQNKSLSFGDLLDVLNPLQHLPVISAFYQDLTNDTIKPAARVIGGGLYGGLAGAFLGFLDAITEEVTGKTPGHHIMTLFSGPEEAPSVTGQHGNTNRQGTKETGTPPPEIPALPGQFTAQLPPLSTAAQKNPVPDAFGRAQARKGNAPPPPAAPAPIFLPLLQSRALSPTTVPTERARLLEPYHAASGIMPEKEKHVDFIFQTPCFLSRVSCFSRSGKGFFSGLRFLPEWFRVIPCT